MARLVAHCCLSRDTGVQRYIDVQSAALHPACRPFRLPRWRIPRDKATAARLRFASALCAGPGARGFDGGRQAICRAAGGSDDFSLRHNVRARQ